MIYDNMCELQVREVRVNLQANVILVRVRICVIRIRFCNQKCLRNRDNYLLIF